MANKTILVAQREYLENVRTKTFWIGILAFPLIFAISIGAAYVLNKLKEVKTYAVVDYGDQDLARKIEFTARSADLQGLSKLLSSESMSPTLQRLRDEIGAVQELGEDEDVTESEVGKRLFRAFMELPASDDERHDEETKGLKDARRFPHRRLDDLDLDGLEPAEQALRLDELIQRGELFAYFTIGADPLESLDGFTYVSNNVTDDDLRSWYGTAASKVVQGMRIRAAGISRDVAQKVQERVRFREQKIGESGAVEDVKTSEKANKYAPVGFVYLLWIAIFTAAQMLLTNTVEEKSNRIIEVLLSSVSPLQLMSGKIWGIAATGLTIVGSWVLCALLGVWLAPRLISGFDFPLMEVVGDPLYLASFVVYFLLGYLFYAALLVGIGSVCNSLKEAQNLLQPIFVLLIIPLVSMMFIVQEPNGVVAKALSYIPPFTPFTMMNRAGGPPETYEYVATGVLLLLSVWLAFRAAGKVFRVGILMTGNPPRLREIFTWIREK